MSFTTQFCRLMYVANFGSLCISFGLDHVQQLQESHHSAYSRAFQRHLDNVLQQRSNALATRYVESGPTETKERFYDEIVSTRWEEIARPYETPVPITPRGNKQVV